MRLWLFWSCFDSRNFLKILIFLNILVLIYQLLQLKVNNNQIIINQCSLTPEPFRVLKDEKKNSSENETFKKRLITILDENEKKNSPSVSSNDNFRSVWWSLDKRLSFTAIKEYILSKNRSPKNSITYTTQATYEFIYHAEELCKRWRGPLSVAVYVPGDDFLLSMRLITFMKKCRDPCVEHNITWHMVYDSNLGFKDDIPFPEELFNENEIDCKTNTYDKIYSNYKSTFRKKNKLLYPINILRNEARLAAKTKYVLASDIELYPSVNIVPMFQDLLARKKRIFEKFKVPYVFVLPIFEVKSNVSPPLTKRELKNLFKKGDAIFFHKYVCDACQNFPERDKWIDLLPANNSLNIFQITKRRKDKSQWEPLYIGTNKEPLYEERLSWEGKRDKMSQIYEMCQLDYNLLILDNAFLVHDSGIKTIKQNEAARKMVYLVKNNRLYNEIIVKLKNKYKNNFC